MRAVGRRGAPARRGRRRALPPRPVAGRRQTLVAVSDASRRGAHRAVHGGDGARELPLGHRPRRSRCAPRRAGARVAHRQPPQRGADRRHRQRQRCTLVDRSDAGRTEDLAWSPDGGWLAYTLLAPARGTRAIKLCEVTATRHAARWCTQPEFRDYSPAFDPAGPLPVLPVAAHLRPGLRQRAVRAELPARRAALPDRAAGRRPRRRSSPRRKGLKAERRGRRRAQGRRRRAAAAARRPRRHRAAASPPSRWPRAASARSPAPPAARCVWTVLPIAGAHGRGGHKEAPGRLEVFDFATRRAETLIDKADDFALAADHRTLLVRERQALRAIAADRSRPTTSRAGRRRRAVAQERLDRPGAHARVGRAARGMARRCCARCGACSATSSGSRTCRASTGPAMLRRYEPLLRARGHARRALRPDLGDCRASSAPRTPTRWAATTASRRRWRWATWRPSCASSRPTGATRSRASCAATPGTPVPIRRSTRWAWRRRPASASSPSTASRCRASGRRRRCWCTRPAPRSS